MVVVSRRHDYWVDDEVEPFTTPTMWNVVGLASTSVRGLTDDKGRTGEMRRCTEGALPTDMADVGRQPALGCPCCPCRRSTPLERRKGDHERSESSGLSKGSHYLATGSKEHSLLNSRGAKSIVLRTPFSKR